MDMEDYLITHLGEGKFKVKPTWPISYQLDV